MNYGVVHVTGGQVIILKRPSSGKDMISLVKCINTKFKLNSEVSIMKFEKTLDLLYGKRRDTTKVVKEPGKITFRRKKFFKNYIGFVVEIDKSGIVTGIKHSMKLK